MPCRVPRSRPRRQTLRRRRKLFRFYKTAGYASHSWERTYSYFIPLTVVTVIMALFWVVAAPLIFAEMTVALYLAAMVSITTAFMGWAIGELLLLIPYIRGTDEAEFSIPSREPKLERKLIATGYSLYLALFALGSLSFLGLFC